MEGSEIEALESGLQMIAQHRPVIMVEVHWLGQKFIEFVNRALLPLQYTAMTYQGGHSSPRTYDTTRYCFRKKLSVPVSVEEGDARASRPRPYDPRLTLPSRFPSGSTAWKISR
jgi:hypothetical protein